MRDSDFIPQFARMSPRALDAALVRLDLPNAQFCDLTGVNPKTLRRWLRETTHPDYLAPPFWVTSWLAAAALPGVLDHLHQVALANRVEASRGNA